MNQPTPQAGRSRATRRSAEVRYDHRHPQLPAPPGSREALPPPWPRDDVLAPALLLEVRSINLRGAALLQETARSLAGLDPLARATAVAAGGVGTLIASGLDEWLALDAAARERLASQPFLLFDMALEDSPRWRKLLAGTVGEEPSGPNFDTAPRAPMLAYARVLLHYAWHLARTAPRTAAVVAGMAAETAALLRGCSVERLDELGPRCARWLQPRWPADPATWSELLCAARSGGDPDRTRRASLRALQRIGGILARVERVPARAGGVPLW
jgi:hypothetical protein